MNEIYIKLAIEELESPTSTLTKQYLGSFDLERNINSYVVERVETEYSEKNVIIYFPVKDERFFLEVYVSKENPEVSWIDIESGNNVYFRATSYEHSFQDLSVLTKLSPLTGWNIGDSIQYNKDVKFSALHFNPFPSLAYELEYKLNLLLNELEKDKNGVEVLAANYQGFICIASYRYKDSPGGIHFDKVLIERLRGIGLEIDIDLYIGGKPLKQD